MARQANSRNRAAAVRTRVLSAVTVSVFSAASISWLGATSKTVHLRSATSAPVFTRLENIPSHNGSYRASLVPSTTPPRSGVPLDWSLTVTTAAGAPVTGAAISLDSWMPDDEAGGTRRYVTRELGNGRYRVEGLRFDGPGWWNVRLTVAARATTDSLAFNLVY